MFIGKNKAKKIIIEDVVQNVSEYLIIVQKMLFYNFRIET